MARKGRPSRQRKGGPGKFKSEEQRRMMWARFPAAARKWSKYAKTRRSDWIARRRRKRG